MMFAHSSQEFLETLNGSLRVRVPDVIEKRRHGQSPELFPTDSLVFKQSIDMVICGPCSSDNWGSVPEAIDEIPMGVTSGEPQKSWLHEVLKAQETMPKTILVYQSCCYSYSKSYKDMLRRVFPEIEWHFPSVRDLAENYWWDYVAQDLLKAGYLAIVPTTDSAVHAE
jgi:hypothetical protein